MQNKTTYSASQMRDAILKLKALQGNKMTLLSIEEMLRQAADLMEREEQIRREIKKIDTMEVAPLDGHPMHQYTNTKKFAEVLEFFPKVKEILGEVTSVEREKKYEYAVKWDDGYIEKIHTDYIPSKDEIVDENTVLRRPVGEWEVVRDGE